MEMHVGKEYRMKYKPSRKQPRRSRLPSPVWYGNKENSKGRVQNKWKPQTRPSTKQTQRSRSEPNLIKTTAADTNNTINQKKA